MSPPFAKGIIYLITQDRIGEVVLRANLKTAG